MLWWLIVAVVVVLVVRWLRQPNEPEIETFEPVVFQSFTPATLAKFNGRDDARVLMAIDGKVYDVSQGKQHYGPGGMYENFAGRDASRGMAKHSFDESMLTPIDQPLDKLEDLTKEERAAMDQWGEFFSGKYIHCGTLVDAA